MPDFQDSHSSINIPKPPILSIRQVPPLPFLLTQRLPDIPLRIITATSLKRSLVPIRKHIPAKQRGGDRRPRALRSQHGDLRWDELRCILRLECLRADDIADGETTRDERHGEDAFRVTCDVGCCPLVEDDEGCDDGVDEIDAGEETWLVGVCFGGGKEGQQGASHDAWDATCDEPGPAVAVLADTDADEDREEDGDESGRHVEECSCGRLVADVLDQGGRVCRHDA